MLEILQYATSGFWVFIGCSILLIAGGCLLANVLNTLVRMMGRKP